MYILNKNQPSKIEETTFAELNIKKEKMPILSLGPSRVIMGLSEMGVGRNKREG